MLHIRTMTAADISLGMALKEQAGWNQTQADWERVLSLEPEGCFVAAVDGAPVGTTVVTALGSVAWVMMVLVDRERRGQGIGTAMMRHALEYLDRRGLQTVRLDATPLGEPVYRKLGFLPEYTLHRFEGTAPAPPGEVARPAGELDLPWVSALDRAATGADRSRLLQHLRREQPDRFWVLEERGFLAVRAGSRAWQVGPCIGDERDVPGLLARAMRSVAGQMVFLDVPEHHDRLIEDLERQGFRRQRQLLRMYRGVPPVEDRSRLWLSFGPEKG